LEAIAMSEGEHLIICGASSRAAAFSALRAGLKPWCIDLFADEDLKAKCPVMRIPRKDYPHKLPEWIERYAPPGPWIYTGGLENYPRLVERISSEHSLWGVEAQALKVVRSPTLLSKLDWPTPEIRLESAGLPQDGSWLVKPSRSSGGQGIQPWLGQRLSSHGKVAPRHYQQLVVGEPCAALFMGTGQGEWFLGVTRQLVGQHWLNAAPYAYCGSVGPFHLTTAEWDLFNNLARALRACMPLKGVFGIDCVWCDSTPWVIEINPRYTASVEVVEHAYNCAVFTRYPPIFLGHEAKDLPGFQRIMLLPFLQSRCPTIGKAILFAKSALVFPADGPWSHVLREPPDVRDLPGFADIPAAGTPIAAGQPVLTFFAGASTEEACLEELQRVAAEVDRWLYKGK
jgi:uncharacterized protein